MARRIAASKVNWSAMLERVPENQKSQFLAFKSRSDNYLRRVLANPESAPKLDWSTYKSKIAVPGLVDQFQKSYEALTIPYPTENISSQVDAQEKEINADLKKLADETSANISALDAEIKRILALIPYSEMTMEEFYQAHPEMAIDTFKNPTYWPHNAEEQLNYVDKEGEESAH